MSDPVNTLTPVAASPAPVATTPTTPTTPTTAQVAAHHATVSAKIAAFEQAGIRTVDDAEDYLNAKSELLITWITEKHAATRLLIVAAVVLAFGLGVGFLIGHIV